MRVRKRWLWLLVPAGAAAAFALEAAVGLALREAVDRTGRAGGVALFLAVGLSLLVGGPVWMWRENAARRSAGRKRRYGPLEYAVVVTGGAAFTAVGALWAARG